MPNKAYILLIESTAWRLGLLDRDRPRWLDVMPMASGGDKSAASKAPASEPPQAAPDSANPDPVALARHLRTLLDQQGCADQGLVLAIPSAWCLAAPVATQGLPPRNRTSALLYRLEEKLPLAAEDLAADFLGSGDPVLGVATAASRLTPILRALEDADILVQTIAPTAFLALQERLAQANTPAVDGWLWADGPSLELLSLRGGLPTSWQTLWADHPDHWRGAFGVLAMGLGRDPCLGASSLSRPQQATLAALGLTPVAQDAANLADLALRGAAAVQTAGRRPWADLRQGPLAPSHPWRLLRQPLIAAAVAAALFLLCVSGVSLWRTHHYQQLAQKCQDDQRIAFQELFPGQNVPTSVLWRLQSEERKLRGPGQDLDEDSVSVMQLLHQVLVRLPTNPPLNIWDMKLESGTLYLEGMANSHTEADALAAALRHQQGLTVEPPLTEQVGSSVRFELNAKASRAALLPTPPATPESASAAPDAGSAQP